MQFLWFYLSNLDVTYAEACALIQIAYSQSWDLESDIPFKGLGCSGFMAAIMFFVVLVVAVAEVEGEQGRRQQNSCHGVVFMNSGREFRVFRGSD